MSDEGQTKPIEEDPGQSGDAHTAPGKSEDAPGHNKPEPKTDDEGAGAAETAADAPAADDATDESAGGE